MVNLTMNGIPIQAEEHMTILEAARAAGIEIPTLCYLKDINEIGACRVCLVEIEGNERLHAACKATVSEGMRVFTNSPKVRQARRVNVELILSQHDDHCASCVRSGNCTLQRLCNDLGILNEPYAKQLPKNRWSRDFPLVRNAAKCVKCMRCVQICDHVQGMHVWDVSNTGSRTTVDVSHNRRIAASDCALCGQCITHCPVGALHERDDTQKVFDALADTNKITVVQIAPAVRAAWGEPFGVSREFASVKRLAAALRKMGFNYIFDTDFTADLTIMEEGSELLHRLQTHGAFPMFTSCCPGWVRFLKSRYPEYTDNLSTAKSPQQMFGAVAKSYYAKLLNVAPERIFCVSVMPCLAKKHECALPNMNDAGAGQDVDVVLTTRELDRMLRAEHIPIASLEEEEFDRPLGTASGAGVIFGATGGVMEAALRSAHYLLTGSNPDPEAFHAVRGMEGWKEASFNLAGTELRVAVVSGLGNTGRLMDALASGKVHYDFIEVMACPGGCSGGGGQPIHDGLEQASERADVLYRLDHDAPLRFSHENPAVLECYRAYFGSPLSETAHHLLHTDHHAWQMPSADVSY